jgi:hypothetical protein
MVTKCRTRAVGVVASVSYLIHDGCSQATKTKLIYRTLLACLRNIVNFWSKITRKYNEVNTELKPQKRQSPFSRYGKQLEEIVPMVNSISRTGDVDFL